MRVFTATLFVTVLCLIRWGHAAEIYFTDFEDFPVGPDQWAGTDGWVGNSTGVGVHGIDSNIVAGLGKTAYVGGSQPSGTTLVTLFRSENVDPAVTGVPVMEFETLMGIEDPGTVLRDDFIFNFYNIGGQPLAAIRFSNQESDFGIWRRDGTNQYDTDVEFIRGELHLLYARVDLQANTWSADLDGIPLFTNATFTATTNALTFGTVAVQWDLTAGFVTGYGKNWMLVADWSIRKVPGGEPEVLVRGAALNPASHEFSLSWNGDAGYDYQVEYTDDLLQPRWQSDLPGSAFSNVVATGTLAYSDAAWTTASNRYYRIRRSETP